jgi:hypothetical protein
MVGFMKAGLKVFGNSLSNLKPEIILLIFSGKTRFLCNTMNLSKMKRRALYAILAMGCATLSFSELFAQKSKEPVYIYLTAGGGAGLATHGFLELHSVFLKHHGVYIGFNTFMHEADNVPGDYDAGVFGGQSRPKNYLNGFTAAYSYIFYDRDPKMKDVIRFPVSIGTLLGAYSRPENFRHSGSLLGSNYDFDNLNETSVALTLRAGFEFTPTRAFGISAGVFGVLGRISGGGVYGSLMLGHVGDHQRKKHRAEN